MNRLFNTYSEDHSSHEGTKDHQPEKPASKSFCICRNYTFAVLAVILGSSAIAEIYHNPARLAQQDKVQNYAPYAVVALISRNCPVCLIPNGDTVKK